MKPIKQLKGGDHIEQGQFSFKRERLQEAAELS